MALAPDSSIPVSDSSNVDRESSREGRRNVSYTPRLLSNGKFTVWADFATFLQKVELTKYQVRNYFRQELDNNKIGADNHCRLILMGTYDTQRIQEILHGLIDEYVVCKTCKVDFILNRFEDI